MTPSQIRAAIRSAFDSTDPALGSLPPDLPLAAIAGGLQQLVGATDQTLRATNIAPIKFLPDQLDRLRTALGAQPAGLASVPPHITSTEICYLSGIGQ